MKSNNLDLREELEQMETSQLDAVLLEELRKEAPDGEVIRLISDILKERDREKPLDINANILRAWERYQRKTQLKAKRVKYSWVKVATVILVVTVLMLCIPQKTNAKNFFERLIAWSEDVFALVNPAEASEPKAAYVFKTDNPGLQEVYDKVTELGVTVPVVPMWVPDGYELVKCIVDSTPTKAYLAAQFNFGNKQLIYQINVYHDNVTRNYQKDGEGIVQKEIEGITHTIMSNNDMLVALWTEENVECTIGIDCQEEILGQILESIYMVEGN